VAASLNNLALLYCDQGRYAEAEPLYGQALAIRQQQLGADHPDVAASLNNLAALYRDQGRYADAEPLYLQAVAICDQQLGARHPQSQTVGRNFGAFLQQVVQHDRTAELSDHPLTRSLLQQIQVQDE
jgi:tetratricopeptide (TPR) repeat protein